MSKSLLKMANPRRNASLESVGSQRRDRFVNLEQRRDCDMAHTHSQRAPFVHSDHIGQHHTSHNSHDEEVYDLKRKVDRLHRHLHRKARIREERTSTPSQSSSSKDDRNYWQRSKTPPNESFTSSSHYTLDERYHHKRSRTPPRRNIGNDAMGKALLQISCSPFTKRIE